jgi:hypothetical protein
MEVEIDMPIDIIDDKHRLKAIEGGLVKSISKVFMNKECIF